MKSVTGRGAVHNPHQRFQSIEVERDPEFYAGCFAEEAEVRPSTRFWEDQSRSLLTKVESPDLPFFASLNTYRGCEHGCSYCYARPTHEYLGYSAGIDFETQIHVKRSAPELLRAELNKKSWQPKVIAMSGVTDPYQPAERHFRLTRGCLEVLLAYRNPVRIITKNHLVVRDLDLLGQLASFGLVTVHLSITSLDPELSGLMEPRASRPERRLRAIRELHQAGVPVAVMASPVVPGLTDHELPEIFKQAAEAGAHAGGYIPLRLPGPVAEVFLEWLEEHFPQRKQKVIHKIQAMRGGKLNDSNFYSRFQGEGKAAQELQKWAQLALRRAGLDRRPVVLREDIFRRPQLPGPRQLDLFGVETD